MGSKKKKRSAPEAERGKKAAAAPIFVLAFFSGMAVMALELAASRLFAPYFGSSVFVWAGLIGVLLLFLSVGYYAGGRLSKSGAGEKKLFGIALAAAAISGATPYIAMPVMILTSKYAMTGAGLLPGVLATSVAALGAPLVMLGCVLPLATGILSRGADDAGAVAGRLYAVSTIGSILGVFLPVLVTLPTIGTRLTFAVFSVALAVAAAAGLGRAVWFAALLVFVPYAALARAIPIKPVEEGAVRLAERETMYNYVQIVKKSGEIKMSVDRGWLVFSKYRPGRVRSDSYRDYFPLAKIMNADEDFPSNICILGAAGGTDARVLRHVFPKARITGVEIDPGLVELGEKYMELKGNVDRIAVADGRAFLRAEDEKYDYIIVDVYNQSYIPFHMATEEFFRLVRERLTPRGVVAFNVAWRTPENWELVLRAASTVGSVFPSVYMKISRKKSNTLIFASAFELSGGEILENIERLDNDYVKGIYYEDPSLFREYNSTAEVFTDDLAPVEYYTERAIGGIFRMISGKEGS